MIYGFRRRHEEDLHGYFHYCSAPIAAFSCALPRAMRRQRAARCRAAARAARREARQMHTRRHAMMPLLSAMPPPICCYAPLL